MKVRAVSVGILFLILALSPIRSRAQEPADVPHGVPSAWHATLRLPAFEDRPIVGEFNEERIVARPWPAKDGHYTIIELTG